MSATAIDRLNAALSGRYRIESELGEGGMARWECESMESRAPIGCGSAPGTRIIGSESLSSSFVTARSRS